MPASPVLPSVLPQWGKQPRQPYHDYVHRLASAGWLGFEQLDAYMHTSPAGSKGLVLSVVDISNDLRLTQWPDMQSEGELTQFLSQQSRKGVKIRLYIAETEGPISPGVMEALGSSLSLDPRFFSWNIHGAKYVFRASEKQCAPFIRLGFAVLKHHESIKTDVQKFKALAYVLPDVEGDGYTVIMLFTSKIKIPASARLLTPHPPFKSPVPPSCVLEPKSIRELYIDGLEYVNIVDAIKSPFLLIRHLLLLNNLCWDDIIDRIRMEDLRIQGISNTTVGHTEEIKKSLAIVQRKGSLGWKGADEAVTLECQAELEADFKDLLHQTDRLWQNRDRIKRMRKQKAESRWNYLTNAFTYFFAPITIMSGIYGMNVVEISGTNANPSIWQPFVAVAIMSTLIVLVLASSNWFSIKQKDGRKAGFKEVLKSAVQA